MSRDYAKVRPEFWTRGTGKGLRGDLDAQVVALYLITGPASHMTGLFYLPAPTLSHETGIPLEGALKALQTLANGGFAFFDESCDLVWVPNMAREQIGASLKPRDHQIRAVVKHIEKFGTHPFYQRFIDLYGRAYSLPCNGPSKPIASPFEGPSQGPRNGRGAVPPLEGYQAPLTDPLRSQDQDQDQEQDQEQEQEQEVFARAIPLPGRRGSATGSASIHTPTAAASSSNGTNGEAQKVSSEDVARAWAETIGKPGANPKAKHSLDSWRAKFETIAAACNEVDGNPTIALHAVIEWFWFAPDGPVVQKRRMTHATATPGHLARYCSRDLEAAKVWWFKQRESPKSRSREATQ